MIGLDASALCGAVERDERRSKRARRFFQETRGPFVSTEACLSEPMYLAGSRLGWRGQNDIWRVIDGLDFVVAPVSMQTVQGLMRRYRDVPMDFANAILVAFASSDRSIRIATFDHDFLAYRRDDGAPVPLVDDGLSADPSVRAAEESRPTLVAARRTA